MDDLKDSHAIVTGASRGLGVHIARGLAREGVHLTLSARSERDLEKVTDELKEFGIKAEIVTADLTIPDQISNLAQKAEELLGPVDILVNNAGIEYLSPFHKIPPEELELSILLNLLAHMRLTRAILPGMIERNKGHIINISSLAGKTGLPYHTPYASAKAGLIQFTHSLRSELYESEVEASVICPGFVSDDGMFARMKNEADTIPAMLKPTTPEKVTDAVLKALKKKKADLIVNAVPVRPSIMLGELMHGLTPFMHKSSGLTDLAYKLYKRRENTSD